MFEFRAQGIDVSHRLDHRPLTVPEIAKHYHSAFEIFCFASGDAYMTVEGGITRLVPGEVIFIRPGLHHIVTLDRATPYERYVLKFPPAFVPEHVTDRFGDATFLRADGEISAMIRGLDELYNRFYGHDLFLMLSCRIRELSVILSRAEGVDKEWERDAFADDVAAFVNAHLTDRLTMDDVCREFGRSRAYIGRRFGERMQTPVMQYARTKKIVAAMHDIARGVRPADAAATYGFDDYSTFYRAYVKIVGAPPTGRGEPSRG